MRLKLCILMGTFLLCHEAGAAQFDCKVGLNAPANVTYEANFYGEGTGEIINSTFNLNQIELNLRVFLLQADRLLIQLSKPQQENTIWLSSESTVSSGKGSASLLVAGKMLSSTLEGLSFVECTRR